MKPTRETRTNASLAEASEVASLTSKAYLLLRRDIMSGRLKPGEKLKVEDLRQLYGLGASPLREALNLLTSDRLVDRIDQRGFRVASVGGDDFAVLLKTRCWLEERALRESIAAGGEPWEEAVLLAAHRLSRTDRWNDQRHTDPNPEWERAHKGFHMALIGGCGSSLLIGFCEQMYDQNVRYRQLSGIKAYPSRDVAEEHSEISSAVLKRDADRAVELLVRHYNRTGKYLMEMFG